VSMRRIAAEMSYGTASLYRYITIEDELLDLRVDSVLSAYTLHRPSGNCGVDMLKLASASFSGQLSMFFATASTRSRARGCMRSAGVRSGGMGSCGVGRTHCAGMRC